MPNSLAITNVKGGVGKTSIAVNIAAFAALVGWRALIVDLDPQGDVARDLGVRDRVDRGRSLADGIIYNPADAVPINVRDHLDLLAGGVHLNDAEAAMQSAGPERAAEAFWGVLHAQDVYDIVVVDCPVMPTLIRAALGAVDACLVPVRLDGASFDGLEHLAAIFPEARVYNPRLVALGVVMFAVDRSAPAVTAESRYELAETLAGTDVPVLTSTVRASPRSAMDTRRDGQTVVDYERAAQRESEVSVGERIAKRLRRSRSAGGLADDYQSLTSEVLRWFAALDDQEAGA